MSPTPRPGRGDQDGGPGMGGLLGRSPGPGPLAVDVTEHLADLQTSRARVERFTSHARQWWQYLYGDDPLILSLPGVGPATGPCIRAYFGDGSGFDSAKKAANYVGMTP
jgi:transposase